MGWQRVKGGAANCGHMPDSPAGRSALGPTRFAAEALPLSVIASI
jgi:hypothetical protein